MSTALFKTLQNTSNPKYEFKKGNFIYAISTQWYAKNDEYVKNWIEKN